MKNRFLEQVIATADQIDEPIKDLASYSKYNKMADNGIWFLSFEIRLSYLSLFIQVSFI